MVSSYLGSHQAMLVCCFMEWCYLSSSSSNEQRSLVHSHRVMFLTRAPNLDVRLMHNTAQSLNPPRSSSGSPRANDQKRPRRHGVRPTCGETAEKARDEVSDVLR